MFSLTYSKCCRKSIQSLLKHTDLILKNVAFSSTFNPLKEEFVFKEENKNKKAELIEEFTFINPTPYLDTEYLCNHSNIEEIENNIIHRKGVGDIQRVHKYFKHLQTLNSKPATPEYNIAFQQFLEEAIKIPNRSHPDILKYGEKPHVLKTSGVKKTFSFKPKSFKDIANSLSILKNDNISKFVGQRGYYFMGQLAELESALVQWSLKALLTRGFQLISVPDILNRKIIESCGMNTKGNRNQVYTLSEEHYGKDLCLSGTAEMAIAGYLMNQNIPLEHLPLRLAAVSRCYRAETSKISEERGIFRVHHFTKVEMFAVTKPDDSTKVLEEFRDFEEEQFTSLGLHVQVLDMPLHELGAQAYRKYDIEAWMPGKEMWGEVSSCSDCTDYQSRRLSIKSGEQYLHTVNGTACAVPRLVIALLETHQRGDGTVDIPLVLQPFMRGSTRIDQISNSSVPHLKPRNSKTLFNI